MQVGDTVQRLLSCCRHQLASKHGALVLVSVGNVLRGDDGVAQAICQELPDQVLDNVCRFDLGSYTNLLIDCLSGHDSAIIVDSTFSGAEPGTVTIIDLKPIISTRSEMLLQSCHGFSIVDELQLARWRGLLPGNMLFFGIEVANVDWGEGLSETLRRKLPDLTAELKQVIDRALERSFSYA